MLTGITTWLFAPSGLTAHGFCLLWEPWLIWTHAGADAATGVAYFTMPLALVVYATQRRDMRIQPVLWLFAAFILLCGAGHWLDLLTLWVPAYRLEGAVKIATAATSIVTAVAVWRLLPLALKPPSADLLRQANAALRDREAQITAMSKGIERLHNVVEASPTALILTGVEGRIMMVNATAERMFGYGRAELVDQPLEVLLPGALRDRHVALRDAFIANASPRMMGQGRPLLGLRKDSATFPLEIGLSPIDLGGETMVLAGINDITARCEADRMTQQHQRVLEQTNAELVRARIRAEQATRAKSRFLASMTHELRTPLNGILGYAQLLGMDGGLTKTQSSRVEAMRGAGQHLLDMITSVLDLSEIETGHVKFQSAAVKVRDLVAECVNVVRPAADAKRLSVSVDIAADVPDQVDTDPTRLRQVLLNLLGNAAKFTNHGCIEVRLRLLEPPGAATRRLLVEIADTGRGIKPEHRNVLFQDFERLATDPAGMVEGAGLGLAICARLLALMDGSIHHANNPGGGSVFTFDLPLRFIASTTNTMEIPTAASPSEPESREATTTPTSSTPATLPSEMLRVLVVDDIAMNRDIAGSFLAAAGHAVTFAEGGEQAIQAVSHNDYDIVLMDLRMPEVDGFEATRRIRALGGKRARVPIVALTAHAFADQIEACRRAGMVGHLAKPFTQQALLAALLNGAERGRAALTADPVTPAITAAPLPVLDVETFETTMAFLTQTKITKYLEGIVQSIQAVQLALASQQGAAHFSDDLIDAVHGLAGSASMVGFVRLGAAARQFERSARTRAAWAPALADEITVILTLSLDEAERRLHAARAATKILAAPASNEMQQSLS